MKKERKVIRRILDMIYSDDLQIGAALPSERKLAMSLDTSRNTVRNALRQLEARGFLDVRRGSGYFLLCKDDRSRKGPAADGTDATASLQSLFEARYRFEPLIAEMSAESIGRPHLAELEKCLMRLSRAMLSGKTETVIFQDIEFRKIMASGTQNRFMVTTIHRLQATNRQALSLFPKFRDTEKEAVFADWVALYNSLKRHHPKETRTLAESSILHLCDLVMTYSDTDMPPSIWQAVTLWKNNGLPLKASQAASR